MVLVSAQCKCDLAGEPAKGNCISRNALGWERSIEKTPLRVFSVSRARYSYLSGTLLHTPTSSTGPPLALHEVPAGMAAPADGLLGQPRHGGVEGHERLDRLFGITVPDRARHRLGRADVHVLRFRDGWEGGQGGAFGAAGVAAEVVGWVDEGADFAGPGV